MDAEPLYSFPARMESLAAMLTLLKSVSFGTDSPAVLRAETTLEELLTNSVVYGCTGSATHGMVWLSVTMHDDVLALRYEDAFAAFDPLPQIDEALHRTSSPMDQRPLGGLGLLMVYRLADDFRYTREAGRNCMRMVFRERSLSPAPS